MTQDDIVELTRLLDESDISTWPMEDQLAISAAYLTMVSTIKPIVLRNVSKDKKTTFLFKIGGGMRWNLYLLHC